MVLTIDTFTIRRIPFPPGHPKAGLPLRGWENKLFEYRDTHSIEQIVIIESETRSVRSYARDDERQWRQDPTLVGDGLLVFRIDDVVMTLDEIYRRTSLAAPDNASPGAADAR